MAEVPLRGGRTTCGVVRVGHTVRRPSTPNSSFVQRLLDHLEASGFDGAPRSFGTDDRGRDILGFIEGDVPSDLSWHAESVLTAAAGLIRRYHDATAAFAASIAGPTSDVEVVCHNDLSPCNFAFRDGLPAAIIDFDAAAVGTRVRDLGYAAWLWLDLGSPDVSAGVQERRLSLFMKAYGSDAPDRAAVVDAMLSRQDELIAEGKTTGNEAMERWAADCRDWVRQHLAR